MENLTFDADESFGAAMTLFSEFTKSREEEGLMAVVSLARALGTLAYITSDEDDRDIALSTLIEQLCNTFNKTAEAHNAF